MKSRVFIAALLCAALVPNAGCKKNDACTSAPDLKADRVMFEILSKSSQWAGRVRITGVVRNVGERYESAAGQQTANLYEVQLGGSVPASPQAARAFTNVVPGGELTVTYERDWNSSSPAEGEFPPSYRLQILFDPDIQLDDNDCNDDQNPSNDVLTVSGSAINDLFRNP